MSMFQCDQKVLATLLSKHVLPESQKTDISKLKPSKKRKIYRTEYPEEKEQEIMRDVEQNTPEWMEKRGGSAGGSVHGALNNIDGFSNNKQVWLVESGRITVIPSQDIKDYQALDHGHYFEDEVALIYSHVMGVKVYKAGIVLHPKFCISHVSPDGIVEYPKGVYHNKYALLDVLRGLLEIKCPQFHIYQLSKNNRMYIPAHYLLQVWNQMDCLAAPWVEFVVHWRARPDDESKNGWPQPEFETKGEGVYKVAETMICRVYANQQGANKVIQMLCAHLNHLKKTDIVHSYKSFEENKIYSCRKPTNTEEMCVFIYPEGDVEDENKSIQLETKYDFRMINDGSEIELISNEKLKKMNENSKILIRYDPKLIENAENFYPDVILLPLKWIRFYIKSENSNPPINETCTELIGDVFTEIDDFWDQKPLQISVKSLVTKSDVCIELDAVPAVTIRDRNDVKNPLFKRKLEENPNKSISDVIFEWVTEKKQRIDRNVHLVD